VKVARLFAVVAFDRELNRLDATKVLLRQGHLGCRDVDGIGFEVLTDLPDQRADHVHMPDAELRRLLVEVVAKLRAHQGEHDHRPLGGRVLEDGSQAASISDAALELEPDAVFWKLKERCSGDPLGRLPGGWSH